MLKKQTLLRSAALPAAAALFTMGAVGPSYACDHGEQRGHGKPASHGGTSAETAHSRHSRTTGSGPSHTAGRAGSTGSNGRGHTPVTVCHLLGNGSYHLLTFDENALKAHLGHGDLYPVPASGCPTEQPAGATPGETAPLPGTEVIGAEKPQTAKHVTPALRGRPATVLGAEKIRAAAQPAVLGNRATGPAARPAAVLGAATTGSASVAPAQAAASGGILPQTGAAGPLGVALLAGIGLLAGGVAMVTRKRPAER